MSRPVVCLISAFLSIGPAFAVDVATPAPRLETEQPITGTVSLYDLQHKIPSKALKEGRVAEKYAKNRDMKAYIEHQQKAVALDPDWTGARLNLGIAYLLIGENEQAVPEFEEVLKRDSYSLAAYDALSCAYLGLNRPAESETVARRALNLNSAHEPSRYYLGVSLAFQHKDDSRALEYLQKVSGRFPKAHIVVAQILERLGMKQAARGQLEEYPSSGDTEVKTQVKTWLSLLN